jgi:hypothetical protein
MTGGRYASQEALDRAQHGFTNIELRCSECGDVKVVQAVGRAPASAPQHARGDVDQSAARTSKKGPRA